MSLPCPRSLSRVCRADAGLSPAAVGVAAAAAVPCWKGLYGRGDAAACRRVTPPAADDPALSPGPGAEERSRCGGWLPGVDESCRRPTGQGRRFGRRIWAVPGAGPGCAGRKLPCPRRLVPCPGRHAAGWCGGFGGRVGVRGLPDAGVFLQTADAQPCPRSAAGVCPAGVFRRRRTARDTSAPHGCCPVPGPWDSFPGRTLACPRWGLALPGGRRPVPGWRRSVPRLPGLLAGGAPLPGVHGSCRRPTGQGCRFGRRILACPGCGARVCRTAVPGAGPWCAGRKLPCPRRLLPRPGRHAAGWCGGLGGEWGAAGCRTRR